MPARLQTTLLALLLAASSSAQEPPRLRLPTRPADAPAGGVFVANIAAATREQREAAIIDEITRGNIPPFLRRLKPIHVTAIDSHHQPHDAVYFVTADCLSIGTDDDFFRAPMRPQAAQSIAHASDTSLITVKISNDIARQADVQLNPRPLTYNRDATLTFLKHHQIIEHQRQGLSLGLLLSGIKKDVVLTIRLAEREHRVAIYGWHYPEGPPIQPLYVGHGDWHVDYSHGIRLVSQHLLVDGRPRRFAEILRDPDLCHLISDEGPITIGYK